MKACRPYLHIGNLIVQNVFDNSVTPATLLYLCISLHLGCDPHMCKNSGKKEKNASIPINQMYGIDYTTYFVEKAITWHTFKTSRNGDIQWIWSGGWEWWAVSGVIGRWSCFLFTYLCSKICLLLNTPAPVGTTLRCRRNSRRFEAGVPETIFPNRTMHGW